MLDPKVDTLLAVVQTGSFTKAAKHLSLTQPAVSHHINQLEQELNVKLLIRDKNPMTLTREGEIVINYVQRLKGLYLKMMGELAIMEHYVSKFRVGITHTSESNRITDVLACYSALHPETTVTIITDNIDNLYSMLDRYEIDVAICEGKRSGKDFNIRLLDTDNLKCVFSPKSYLAKQGTINIDDVRSNPLIMRLPSSGTRQLINNCFGTLGMSLEDFEISIEIDSTAAIKDLVAKNLGISILAESSCREELRNGTLCALPITGLDMSREINLVYRKDFTHIETINDISEVYKIVSNGEYDQLDRMVNKNSTNRLYKMSDTSFR